MSIVTPEPTNILNTNSLAYRSPESFLQFRGFPCLPLHGSPASSYLICACYLCSAPQQNPGVSPTLIATKNSLIYKDLVNSEKLNTGEMAAEWSHFMHLSALHSPPRDLPA